MTRRAVAMALLGIGVVVAASGLSRVRFDPDILGMLPQDSPEVAGLRALQKGFAKDGEVVVLIEGKEDHEGGMGELAESLAKQLEESGVAARARWRPAWMDGGGMAEWLAYLWLNGPADVMAEKAASLAPERLDATMQAAVSQVATALEGEDLAMRAHDPLGFLRHPALDHLLAEAGENGVGFESPDGRAHLLFVDAPGHLSGYRNAGAWLAELKSATDKWCRENGGGIDTRFTGEPVFAAEIGGAMEHDMSGTAGITAGLIALLFWLAQRRFALLGGLMVVLGMVFLTAIGLAGWIYGELSVVAAAFAAILLGLVVDYGVLICQEAKVSGHDRVTLWRATRGSIFWAAVTTAVVFFALNRSGLPGIAQLGTVVACGILAGAALMLGWYLPFVAKAGAGRASLSKWSPVPSRRVSLLVAAALALLSVASLFWHGLPGVDFDEAMMRPRGSPAMAAFDRLREKFPAWGDDALRVVVEAGDDATMNARLAEAAGRLETHKSVEDFVLPAIWWPDAHRQSLNRDAMLEISSRADDIFQAADRAGFSSEGLALSREVLREMERMAAADKTVFPESEGALEIMRPYLTRNANGGGCMAGVVHPAEGIDITGDGYDGIRTLNGVGIHLASWELIKPAVVPLVRKDVTDVFLPMAVLMIVMLAGIFRNARVVAWCLASMALGALVMLAAMSWLGIDWNFLNIAAAPLLLGIGIDYVIHTGLALRRNGGDVTAMWHGTGKAVVFCALTTAIGFGSLCFASNEAMASLGVVAVSGIIAGMLVSVLLLPRLLAPEYSSRGGG